MACCRPRSLPAIAGVATPTADALLRIGETLTGIAFATEGRTAERMGIAGLIGTA